MGSKAIHTESDRAFCQSLKRVWPEGSVYTSHQLKETQADPRTAAVSQEALCVPKGQSSHWISCKRSKLSFKTVWPALLPSCQGNFLLRTPYHSCGGWGRAWEPALRILGCCNPAEGPFSPLSLGSIFSCFWEESFRTWNFSHARVPREQAPWRNGIHNIPY